VRSPRLWLFLLALTLAVALKLAVHEGERTSIQTLPNVSIQTSVPAGFVVLNPVNEAQVQVRGKISEMSDLNPLTVRLVADVSAERPGMVEVPLTARNLQNAGGLEVLSISPNLLVLEVDREITKVLAIKVDVVGEPAAGAQAGTPIVRPPSVEVIGPESLLRNLSELGANVSVERRAISFEERVTPTMPQFVRLVTPTSIVVFVKMKEPALSIDDDDHAGIGASSPDASSPGAGLARGAGR